MIKYNRVNNISVKPPPIAVQIMSMFKTPGNVLFDSQFPNIGIFGKKRSGKTNLILNILDCCVNDKTIIIIFCGTVDVSDMWRFICDKYRDKIVKYTQIEELDKNSNKKINNLKAFIERMKLPKRNSEDNNYVIIFDDISDELRSPFVEKLAKENFHFKSINIISTQSIKDITPKCIQNLNYCLLMPEIPQESIQHIHKNLRLLIPEDEFQRIYSKSTEVPYNFLYIDCGKEQYRKNFDLEILNESDSPQQSDEEVISDIEEESAI